MTVTETLKGENLKEFSLYGCDEPNSQSLEIGPGLDCKNHGGVDALKIYLVFLNSTGLKTIRPISGDGDAWLLKVRYLIAGEGK